MREELKTLSIAVDQEGNTLFAHLGNPRFCVGAKSAIDAREKAIRAFEYFNRVEGQLPKLNPKEVRVITPIYESMELCA